MVGYACRTKRRVYRSTVQIIHEAQSASHVTRHVLYNRFCRMILIFRINHGMSEPILYRFVAFAK